MKTHHFILSTALLFALGCDTENATTVVVDNDYPVPDSDAGAAQGITVFKVWWAVSLLPDPVSPGKEGQTERTVPSSDFAYALLAPGWDPSSSAPPATLIAVQSSTKLTAGRGDVLHVRVSDAAFVGNCAAGTPLTQTEADFITTTIFPGELAGSAYDAKTCAIVVVADGGADALADGASDAESDARD